ncbi:MAG: hypothetical protein WAM77_01610 [Xanthobacteraceae bacterium]
MIDRAIYCIGIISIILAAIIRAFEEALAGAPRLREFIGDYMPSSAFFGYVPLGLLVLAGLIFLLRAGGIGQRPKRFLEILSPLEGDEVGASRVVRGAMKPPGNSIQLLVYGRDKKWHPQPPTSVDRCSFMGTCHFGAAIGGVGSYQVVAIVAQQPIDTPISKLPRWALCSQQVTVRRSD